MANFYDLAYGVGLVVGAPLWAARRKTRRSVIAGLRRRRAGAEPRTGDRPAVLLHAVSVGEVNAISVLVRQLQQQRPELQIVVSTTSEQGFARAMAVYGSAAGVRVVRFPLDFTGAINRWLDALRPGAVVLLEGELWPNFLRQCAIRSIPVLLINGRMTSSAFRNYRLIWPISQAMLGRISLACVQDEICRQRFAALGMPAERLRVTGTMKFDTAHPADRADGDAELAAAMGLPVHDPDRPVWVIGSSGPGEEEIVLRVYRRLLARFPRLILALVPRHPERFDAVASLIREAGFPLVRRSDGGTAMPTNSPAGAAASKMATNPPAGAAAPVVLGDTMGELRKFYSLASVVFVGRSLVDLGPRQHGSDMIEAAALAKPVAVGPWTHNFAEVMRQFRSADSMAEVQDEAELENVLADWLEHPAVASEIGRKAQAVVRENQGATGRHAEVILRYFPTAGMESERETTTENTEITERK